MEREQREILVDTGPGGFIRIYHDASSVPLIELSADNATLLANILREKVSYVKFHKLDTNAAARQGGVRR